MRVGRNGFQSGNVKHEDMKHEEGGRLAGSSCFMSSRFTYSLDSILLHLLLVQLDAEARLVADAGAAPGELERLGQQIVLVEVRADDVAGEDFGVDALGRQREVDHGGGADAHLQVAPDRA